MPKLTQLRFMKKTPKTLSKVIQIVEKFNAAQQLTAKLTPSMVRMMSMIIGVFFVDEQVILATTAPIYSVTAGMNSATLHKTAPTRFLTQEHHTPPRQVSFKATIHLHLKGQITLHPLWAQTWKTFQPITIMPPFPP